MNSSQTILLAVEVVVIVAGTASIILASRMAKALNVTIATQKPPRHRTTQR